MRVYKLGAVVYAVPDPTGEGLRVFLYAQDKGAYVVPAGRGRYAFIPSFAEAAIYARAQSRIVVPSLDAYYDAFYVPEDERRPETLELEDPAA